MADELLSRGEASAPSPTEGRTADGEDDGEWVCPDCGTPLRLRVPGFRPLTVDERRRLTPEAVRVLGLCPNLRCL